MISAKIIADSICNGNRITTMEVVFPRFILAELNTHRLFSRNSASSRAIPFEKMVKSVEENSFIPIAWQKDHKGMQGTEYFTEEIDIFTNQEIWLKSRDSAINSAKSLSNQGVTKQLCNRLLEPFIYHKVLITSTEWDNFFELRCPQYEHGFYNDDGSQDCHIYKSKKDFIKAKGSYAPHYSINGKKYEEMDDLDWLKFNKGQSEIHMMALAEAMWDAKNESNPVKLKEGEYHIPYGDNIKSENLYSIFSKDSKNLNGGYLGLKIKISTARCARLSYQTLGDDPKIDYEADVKLHDMLLESGHFSPFEHCARAMTDEEYVRWVKGKLEDGRFEIPNSTEDSDGWCNNFRGFIQYRHLIENK